MNLPSIHHEEIALQDVTYRSPNLGGRRASDRETLLLNELDFERKVSIGLLATITRLEIELAKRGSGMEQLTTAVAKLRELK
jgi:hypothetical protein